MDGDYDFPDSRNKLSFSQGLVEKLRGKKFLEMVGKEESTDSNNLNKTTSKTIITYVQIN